jgi:hypothetical protein
VDDRVPANTTPWNTEYTNKRNVPVHAYYKEDGGGIPPADKKRMCGLAPRTFYILFAVVCLVVIAAAVGGGVGGSLASKKSTSTPPGSPASTTTNDNGTQGLITVAPSSTTASISLTTTIGPSTTLISDCPSSNNTVYSANGALFRKICGNSFQNSNGIDAVVNQPTALLNDCINMCASYNLANKSAILAGTNKLCSAVCWRATITGDDFPGQCFGYTTQNSSGNFLLSGDVKCNSAAWINIDLQ